ncbi:MAG: cytochrome c family protein [Caldisericaceae bacterium]|nr:cytochrome c family protein [Caldisericaceae bacterium]
MRKTIQFLSMLFLVFSVLGTFAIAKDFKYVGAAKCKTCHNTKKSGKQYTIWKNGPHAKAMESLKSEKSLKYAKEHGIADPSKDPKCTKCHSTMAAVDKAQIDPKGKLTMEEGVSCESCHGPGSAYKKMSVMKNHEKALANGLIVPDEKLCITCHNEKNPFHKPFNYKEYAAKIAHPTPKKK